MARGLGERLPEEQADVGGIGGTLAANVLSLAAMRATLGEVLTEEAFGRMIALGERFEAGVDLYALNRGILLTPFHNMALMSPATTDDQIEWHAAVFEEGVRELAVA